MATDDRARLEAQAEGGQAGLAAYDRAAAEISERRSEALENAMAESATRTGSTSETAAGRAIQNIINAPVDRRLDDIAQGRATLAADFDRLNQAQSAYMSGVQQFGSRAAAEQRRAAEAAARQRALEDALFNRYGGYATAGEYENAVTGGALALQQEQLAPLDQLGADEAAYKKASAGQANAYLRSILGRAASANSDTPTRAAARDAQRRSSARQADTYLSSIAQRGASGRSTRSGGGDEADYLARASSRRATRDMGASGDALAQILSAPPPTAPNFTLPVPTRSDRDVLRELAELRSRHVGIAPVAQEERAMVMSPQNLQDLRRQFAINELGADPLEAMGRFAPLSEDEILEQQLAQARLGQNIAELEQFGPGGRDEFLAQLVAERTGGFDLGQLSTATNLAPEAVAGAVSSPEFGQLLEGALAGEDDPVRIVEETAEADPILAIILEEILASMFPAQFDF